MSRSVTKLKFLDITKNQRVPEKDENIPEKIRVHTEHLREIGRDMLKLRVDEKADMEKEQAEIREQQAAVGKLLRRRIKVSDMQDGGASISMDQEWDTSGWSTEMIEGGCQAILLLFQETGANSDLRKQRALQMLDKLIYRHDQAHKYVKHSLESIINKTCNRKVRGGRGASFVDLLHVCHSLKVKFVDEQSHHNFCGKFYDMCLVESKLACILIQHTFRKFRDNSRRRPMEGLIAGFGSEAEINMLRKRAVNARSSEIRAIWRLMHAHMSESQRNQPGGIRGPCTISQEHVFLGLQTTLHLVSDKATRYATSNREDVVYSHGIISLSTYLGCASGPFAEIASDILCWVSKCPESLMPLLSSGVIQSAYRFMDFLLEGLKDSHRERIESSNSGLITEGSPKKHRHGNASPTAAHSLTRNHDDNYNDNQHQHHYQHHAYLRKNLSDKTKSLYTNCIRLICRCAIHAAGVFRARAGYPCVKSRLLSDDVEEIDYEYVLRAFENKIPPKLIIQQLGDVKMIVELMKMMLNTDNDGILIDTLQALFALAATDCYMELLEQVIAHSGLCFHYIVNLMLREDEVVSTLAMTILLQLCTRANGRNALIHTNAEYHIAPLIPTVDHQYKRVPYCRSMLIVAALIRQHEWQPYEPEYFVETAMTEPQMRRLLFLDLMKTIKIVDFEDSETFDSITLQELVLLPFTDDSTLEQMSKQARVINAARQLSDFLCHPGELSFFESMPWEESAATCQILQALSQSPETSLELFSEGLVNFLGQCLYVSKHAFIGKSIVGMNIQVVLAAVTAASITISHLCKSGNHHTRHALIIINGIKHSNLIGAAAFFIPGLSAANKKLTDKELRFRQESAGFAAVVLMDSYTAMLLTLDEVKMKQLQMGTEEKELSDGHGLLDSSSKPKPTAVGKKRKKKPVPVNRDQPISADHIIARLMAEVEPVGIQITNVSYFIFYFYVLS